MTKSKGELVVYQPRGRPTYYTYEMDQRICDALITTPRGLDFICSQDDRLPSARTVARWLDKYPEFCQRYLRARERQADLIFDECLEIADDCQGDYRVIQTRNGPLTVFDAEHVQRAKLRIDTRMRIAGKLAPKKYGERLVLTGSDGGPIQLEAIRERLADKIASVRAAVTDESPAIEPDD